MTSAATTARPDTRDLWQAYADSVRPQPRYTPADFAERFRFIKEGQSERPGPWSNTHFPYLAPIMDSVEEALASGKRGWVMMKAAQGGGSEAVINVWSWLQTRYGGPILYLISKDELAEEFGRERFTHMLDTMPPLKRIALRGRKGGESLRKKRFTTGKLVIAGGRSVLNLQSQPYRFAIVDEVDSLLDEIENSGDPVKLVEMRTNSYAGKKLVLCFAHPSRRARGAAKLYYEQSDQRRGFVNCPHCRHEFWLQWSHVRAVPMEGMNLAQAERDPKCYEYFCPECAAQITDAQRVQMVRAVRYKSTLDPEEAARRAWLGVHFSALYMPTLTLRQIAEHFVEAQGKEQMLMVFWNKLMGEPYESAVREVLPDQWRARIVVQRGEKDPDFYTRGHVPRGVNFLTAGQDSRSKELHFSVWAWGLVRHVDGYLALRGWLIDWDIVTRPVVSDTVSTGELHAFDELIYDARWPAVEAAAAAGPDAYAVTMGAHDARWSRISVNEYCRTRPGRAHPVMGFPDRDHNQTPAPPVRLGAPLKYTHRGQPVEDPRVRPLLLNTFALKCQLAEMLNPKAPFEVADKDAAGTVIGKRAVNLLNLPPDADERLIKELSAERLETVDKTKQKWTAKGDNHYWDTLVYAYALALQCEPFQRRLAFDEPAPPVKPRKLPPPTNPIRRNY